MTERCREAWIRAELKILNAESKRKYQFHISGIPSRWQLVVLENNAGGISQVSDFLPKCDQYSCIRAINEYNRKEKTKPFEKID